MGADAQGPVGDGREREQDSRPQRESAKEDRRGHQGEQVHGEPASLPLDTGGTTTAPWLSLPARTTVSICLQGQSLSQPDDNNLVVVIVGFLWPMTQPTSKLLYSRKPAIAGLLRCRSCW